MLSVDFDESSLGGKFDDYFKFYERQHCLNYDLLVKLNVAYYSETKVSLQCNFLVETSLLPEDPLFTCF